MGSSVFGQVVTIVGSQSLFIPRSWECLYLKTKQIRISETSLSAGRKIQRHIPEKMIHQQKRSQKFNTNTILYCEADRQFWDTTEYFA